MQQEKKAEKGQKTEWEDKKEREKEVEVESQQSGSSAVESKQRRHDAVTKVRDSFKQC